MSNDIKDIVAQNTTQDLANDIKSLRSEVEEMKKPLYSRIVQPRLASSISQESADSDIDHSTLRENPPKRKRKHNKSPQTTSDNGRGKQKQQKPMLTGSS